MRVLWFTNIMLPEYAQALGRVGYNSGGWMQSLADAVRRHAPEIQLTVVCQGCDAPKTVNGVDFRSLLPLRGYVYAPKNEKHFLSAMRAIVEMAKPDIIHFHGTENCLQEYYRETGLRYPTITSIQGILSGLLPHCMGGLNSYQVNAERALVDKLLRRWSIDDAVKDYTMRARMELQIFKRGGNFIGRTDWDHKWVVATNSSSRYYHVGEVLRTEFYQEHSRQPAHVIPHRIYCGAAFGSMLKGGHVLAEAVSLLKDKYPDIKICVANASSYNKSGFLHYIRMGYYERYLRALINRLGVRSYVECLPSITSGQVIDQLLQAELYVLASCAENSPNSLGEAMLLRTPVVTTDAGGIPSMLSRERGFFAHAGDPAELACAIDKAFRNREDAKVRAERAYESAAIRFNAKQIVADLKSAYECVMR